jgi:hypothetical protein
VGAPPGLARRALAGETDGETDIVRLLVDGGHMAEADVRVLLEPARLAGQATSPPRLSREYARATGGPHERE